MSAGSTRETLERAARLLQAGSAAEAEALLGTIVTREPANGDALSLLGIALAKRGDAAAAAAVLERAVTAMPEHAAARMNYGNALKVLGRLSQALEQYRKATQLPPKSALRFRQFASLAFDVGDAAAAAEGYRNAAALETGDWDSRVGLGSALLAIGDFAGAADAFSHAARLRPGDPAAYLGRARAARGLGNLPAALYDLDLALQRSPRDVEALTARAVVKRELGRRGEALADCELALGIEPQSWQVLNNRGVLLDELGRTSEAVECFERSLSVNPDNPDAFQNLGTALIALGRGDEALAKYETVLRSDPENIDVWNTKGAVLIAMRRFDDAVAAFDRAIAIQPQSAISHFHRSFALLGLGKLAEGFEAYEWRRRGSRPFVTLPPLAAPDVGPMSDVRGKRLLLVSEQGMGDVIQFARFARSFADRGAQVALATYAPLVKLLHSLGDDIAIVPPDASFPPHDLACPLMSAPHKLGLTLSTIPAQVPYLRAPGDLVAPWRERVDALPPGLRVGLAWSGNPQYANDTARSIAFAALRPLLGVAGATFVCFQRDVRVTDEAAFAAAGVADFRGDLGDFAETAALISALDLVIAVDTSLAHLAGALGKPVWILLSAVADWRWFDGRADSPWYPTARLFRQKAVGNWGPVLDDVAAALRERVSGQ